MAHARANEFSDESGIGLKISLSADDIDKSRKQPGKLSTDLLGKFDSNPDLASGGKQDTRLSQSSPHLLQPDAGPQDRHSSTDSEDPKHKRHAGAHVTITEPGVYQLPINNDEELLSDGEMVDEKDKKRKKRWKWSPWKKMRKIFGRKKHKRAKSCEDLSSTLECTATCKSVEAKSRGDSLRKRTKSEPSLSDAKLKKIGHAVADIHQARAGGGGGAMFSELKRRQLGGGNQELGAEISWDVSMEESPTDLQWITSQSSAQEAGVSFDDAPTGSPMEGLQSAHDKIKAAPKNRRPPTRARLGGSATRKTAPMKPNRKTKTNPAQMEKPEVISGETTDSSPASLGLKLDDRGRSVVHVVEASVVVEESKDAEQEEMGKKEPDIGKEGQNVLKINEEKPKVKPLLPPVVKPLLPKEPKNVSVIVLASSEADKPSDSEVKRLEENVAKAKSQEAEQDESREDALNSIREKANQILSAASGSPKLASKPPTASPRPAPRPGVPLKPTPKTRQKWRDDKNDVSNALDDAFDVLETEDKTSEEKFKENKTSDSPVSPPRPAPRPVMALKPKSYQKLCDDNSNKVNTVDDAFRALETEKETEKEKSEVKETENESSGSTTPVPRRAVALKPTPKSRQKLVDEKNASHALGDTFDMLETKNETLAEKIKEKEDKTVIVLKNSNSEEKESGSDKSTHLSVLRSRSEAQIKIKKDSEIKERTRTFSSDEGDKRKSIEIAAVLPLKPVKGKQFVKENENNNPTPPWLRKDSDIQLRNKQFLVRDTDNRKTCPPKLLATMKLTSIDASVAGEPKPGVEPQGDQEQPPWVVLANNKTKRYSHFLEPDEEKKTPGTDESEKNTAPYVLPKPNSKPSSTTKLSDKTDPKPSVSPSPTTVENRTVLSRSKSVGQTVLEKEKSKSLTRASSEDKPSILDKQGKHGFVPVKLEKCAVCGTTVYQTERCNFDNSVLHRGCIRCTVCKRSLTVGNFVMSERKVYCKNHVQPTVAVY